MDSFVYTLPLIWLVLTKPEQTDVAERGLGLYFFLLAFSWRPCCTAEETAEQNSKFQDDVTKRAIGIH